MARPFPPSFKIHLSNSAVSPTSQLYSGMIIDGLKMIMTDRMNSKANNVVYLCTFIGHGIPSKSREFIYFILGLHMFCSP